MDSWCILRTIHGREDDVKSLTDLPVYVPAIRVFNRRRRVWAERPMYPGYAFIQSENPPHFFHRMALGYVQRPSGTGVALLPHSAVEEVRRVEALEADRAAFGGTPVHWLQPGDEVRVCFGVFSGLNAVVEALLDDLKVRATLQKGNRARIEIDATLLEVVAA